MHHTTFDNKKIPLEELSHQHISNIYWFGRVINGFTHDTVMRVIIGNNIDIKYGGVILPYKPEPRFRAEIKALDKRGLLSWRDDNKADIVFEGTIIGEACYLEDKRQSIIDEIISYENTN
jgi:hypothetical protein